MNRILPANQATNLGNFGNLPTPVYFHVVGPGNVRFGATKQELESQPAPGFFDGMAQAQADGERERFWAGDLWAISDAPNTMVVFVAPQFQFAVSRGISGPPNLG